MDHRLLGTILVVLMFIHAGKYVVTSFVYMYCVCKVLPEYTWPGEPSQVNHLALFRKIE